MAFPTIPTGGRVVPGTQADTSQTRTFPSLTGLTKNAGDLLLALVLAYQSTGTADAVWSSWGGGFTEFGDSSTASTCTIGAAYKWSTGSETGTFSVTQASTVSGHAVFFLLSIPGAHATTIPEIAFSVGSGANADPPSLNPANWDVEDTLWIAVNALGETSTSGAWDGISSGPSGWSSYAETGVTGDVLGAMEGAVAFLQSAAASVDPGTFTNDTSNTRYRAATIAVRPVPEKLAAITFAPAVGVVTQAKRTAVTQSATTATVNRATVGTRTAATSSALALALNTAIEGRRVVLAQSALALTLGIDTTGMKDAVAVVDFPITFGILTEGAVESPPAGNTVYADLSFQMAVGIVTDGYLFDYVMTSADSVDGSWTTQDGGSDLESVVDEPSPSDADYVRSELRPADSSCRFKLEPASDPGTGARHVIRWRPAKDALDGNRIDMKIRLMEGGGDVLGAGALIAEFTRQDVSADFTTYAETLTEGQANTITDYTDLYVELEATVV